MRPTEGGGGVNFVLLRVMVSPTHSSPTSPPFSIPAATSRQREMRLYLLTV